MPRVRPGAVRSSARLHERRCLSCGHAGREMQSTVRPPLLCPNCGEDFYIRPPRSYAEMEGLDGARTEGRGAAPHRARAGAAQRPPFVIAAPLLLLLASFVASMAALASAVAIRLLGLGG